MKLFEFYKMWERIDGGSILVMDSKTKKKHSIITFPSDYWTKEVIEVRREYTDLIVIVK